MTRRRSAGQALIEFAVVLPLFLVMVLGIVDFGRVIWASNSLASSAREAARFAIVHGGSASTACPVGPPVPDVTVIPVASAACPYPSPSKEAIRETAINAVTAGGTGLVVTVCYGTACVGNTDTVGATNLRGTPVTVAMTSQLGLVAPAMLGMSSFTITGSSTMIVNH